MILACATCMFALTDVVLPPVGAWCLLAVVVFVASSGVATWHRARPPVLPTGLAALGVLTAALVVALLVGPLPLLALGLVPIPALLRAARGGLDPAPRRALRRVALGGALGLAAALASLVVVLATRTDVDVILHWFGTPPGRSRLRELHARGAGALPQWREIVDRGDGLVLVEASEAVARFGDPATDGPRLRQAAERAQRSDPRAAEDVRAAADALSPR